MILEGCDIFNHVHTYILDVIDAEERGGVRVAAKGIEAGEEAARAKGLAAEPGWWLGFVRPCGDGSDGGFVQAILIDDVIREKSSIASANHDIKNTISNSAALSAKLLCSSYLPMILRNTSVNGGIVSSFSSQRSVFYSCGRCGYALNLSSSDRNTAGIGAEYGRAIKKGVVSFLAIDESRFTQADELRCLPYFHSRRSWGLFRRRTRLLCRGCGSLIGVAYCSDSCPAASSSSDGASSESNYPASSGSRNYKIRIGALQPSLDDASVPLFP
ncbi:hypothetical protein Cni_G13085 [Canna indica]|uniref:Uncharacterized protein n=1 Tax=Canna indica TaxID=4628 RepID=A0AAQ3QB70_9LILI|nr:hypothetical protein Cni_G13085 [Canna indica]